MDKKTLLLNNNYQMISFINYFKVAKFYVKDKIEVISNWEDVLAWSNGNIKLPAIVRLKYYTKSRPKMVKFNRGNVFKRDMYVCQYCNVQLTYKKATWDHIIPKVKGGKNSWDNCVCCCWPCNSKKSNKMLSEVNMQLINTPHAPGRNIIHEYRMMNDKHQDWEIYFGK